MRAFCTVSAPLEVCAPPSRPLPPGARFLALRLLGTPQPQTLYFLVEAKSRVREVYAQTCHHFSKQGMLDTELFGLAVLIDGEYLFADPESKLSKYGPKSWRSSHTHGLDANGKPLLELHFRVQFYIESPLMLRDEVSRHNYYLQLKTNTIQREVPKECNEQSLILLGGLALQAEVGDCPDEQNTDYIRADEFLPANIRTTWGTTALHTCHKENRALSRADAETHFIKEACGMNETINAHIFRMKTSKNDLGLGSAILSIFAKGLKISVENSQPVIFLWPHISKLCFDKKKFEIRSNDQKHTLYSGNDDKNKMLLALCRDTHQFSMKIAPRLTEAIKREEEESHCMHACYMYSRALNLPYKSKSDQRISVISSTSSNTTSGIVSDRVHSEDELEILINTPPQIPLAAPSTESLALAHLLDCPSVSRQTSSVGQVSMQELNDTLANLSIRSNTLSNSSEGTEPKERSRESNNDSDSSPPSQHNIGSQCSSTCSTVVVQTENLSFSPIESRARTSSSVTGRRQTSTCSSLELGYSHTAQNSMISETPSTCNNHIVFGDTANEDESNSGMYTLAHQAPPTETSGVYTMNSSEMTGESSEMAESETHDSSHYGSFRPNSEMDNESVENLDSVDGGAFRLRSDSNISTSGSFRGDGSDPTDSKHTLLSVEELTELIVGRGTYPSRKTVSNTMDSDCDYVTLPLPLEGESYLQGSEDTAPTEDEYDDDDDELLPTPPAPPKRIDSNKNNNMLSDILEIHPGEEPPAPPPPYNSQHETTGLRGPDLASDVPELALRDPPPYPQKPQPRPAPAIPMLSSHKMKPHKIPEEAAARFVTTRPQINILKAHTSLVGEPAKPSYAAPTISCMTQPAMTATTSSIGIPIVPYKLHNNRKSMPAIPPPQPPFMDNKPPAPRTCVLLPVARQYPRPPPNHRQPPPPPPQLATVYTSQLARSQIELYQQQLYSDVDYVIYPLQDPAISQQEYLDSKQGSMIATMAQTTSPNPYLAYHTVRAHNRSWDACKNHTIYRSTPYLSMAYSSHSRYASTQNLSDTYVQLPGAYSPIYSPSVTSLCSGYEPPPPPPLRPRPIAAPSLFARSRSDDNILNSLDTVPRTRRLPPPPPPPYEIRRTLRKPPLPCPSDIPPAVPAKPATLRSSKSLTTKNLLKTIDTLKISPDTTTMSINVMNAAAAANAANVSAIDIHLLREKSKNLDLPLISALCNDRSLLKQTKAFVMPKHPRTPGSNNATVNNTTGLLSSKGKYPVSGLSSNQLSKPRKSAISHRHPNDKLPPLPLQAEANNYVMDPTPTAMKHKNFNSQQSAS